MRHIRRCVYCGATEKQTGNRHQRDHFKPLLLGGDDSQGNVVSSCLPCNSSKSNRLFSTIDDCRVWLHFKLWSRNTKANMRRRLFAFGGKPPDEATILRGKQLDAATKRRRGTSGKISFRVRGRRLTRLNAIADCYQVTGSYLTLCLLAEFLSKHENTPADQLPKIARPAIIPG